ncbi:phosphodiesterase [Aeromicrobium sp. 636]|uniref:Alkaline phosphatase family protein n=1 Tax=Aeromicrobium senzhongii TaxID=2663859 RepID=A0A8I0K2Y6_9ACTN|nr:alkaline phosphatase family protein [Aeromicrobium sp. 636]MBC9227109.1 alkaline phosphatase family protein [Aeromicrobium senzhongii]MCQ3999209.1 phosphodiesterase [Aeromicrobium sp. 636]
MSHATERGWASPAPERTGASWVPGVADVLQAVWTVVVAAVALTLGLAAVGVSVTDELLLVVVVFVAMFVLDAIVSRPLRLLASGGSVLTALVLGFAAQVLVLGAAIDLAAHTDLGIGDTLVVLLVAGAVMACGRWLSGATDSHYVVGAATGGGLRQRWARAGVGREDRPRGLLVVQLDGVALPVLRRALAGGQAPNIARWVRSSHTLTGWWSTIPCTTPASMAGFLHGSADIPAYRWWDRRAGRLLVAGNPADARVIEARFPADSGLLRDGTAISTTFTGGAARSYLTVSRSTRLRDLGSGSTYLSFFIRPFLLPGALVLTVGEVIKEFRQGHRQRVRDVRPRIPRKVDYAVLRGLTNVLLRKLDLSLIADEMTRGSPIIFVDFVDYDEIAHHAGPERPESMAAIEGLDGALAALEDVARSVATRYDLVVVSDHGQSLGAPFSQLAGCSFADRVVELMRSGGSDATVLTTTEEGEQRGPVHALISAVVGENRAPPEGLVAGSDDPEVAVTGGGNLGMIWFRRLSSRPNLAEIDAAWPALVPGLLDSPGVGLVMSTDDAGDPLVIGRHGVRGLGGSSAASGDDPLLGYPSRTAADLARLHALTDAGDLVVLSTVDALDRVHAFEEQVGSHGGIGGPQNEALFIHPRDWLLDPDLTEVVPELGDTPVLVGAWNVHRQLMAWRAATTR